jgi:hypothetical protein
MISLRRFAATSIALVLFGAHADAQTAGTDRCAAANDEATRIIERCHSTAPALGTSREQSEQQQEECAARGLDELLAWCPGVSWVRLNLGITEANRRHWVRAWEFLREALASHDPSVEEARHEIEEVIVPLVRSNIARVAPTTGAPGATLRVNGRLVGALPLSGAVAVEPGAVTLEVRAPGYRDANMTLRMTGGEEFSQAIPMERAPESSGGSSAGPWVLAGVGATSVIASGVLWVLMNDAVDTRDANCDARAQLCYPEAQEAQERAEALRVGVVTALAVGGSVALGGLFWGLASRRSSSPARAAAWAVGVHPWREGVQLVWMGRL